MRGTDGIAIGLLEELGIECGASRSGASGAVLGVRPTQVGGDSSDL
jgi:hypothetical protein